MSKRLRLQACGGFSGVLPRATREGHKPRRAAHGKRLSVFNPQIRRLRAAVFFFGDENRQRNTGVPGKLRDAGKRRFVLDGMNAPEKFCLRHRFPRLQLLRPCFKPR